MKLKAFFTALVLTAGFALPVSAAVIISMNFDGPVATSATPAPGAFYTDRYAPAGFAAEDGVLVVTVSSADSQSNRSSAFSGPFYNTQGRKYDLAPGAKTIEADLFLDSAWVVSGQREAGLWATAVDASNTVSFFPFIEYALGGFRGWDGDGNYIDLGTGNVGEFNTLGIVLDDALDRWNYLINGVVGAQIGANGSAGLSDFSIQAHNNYGRGVQGSKQVRWDNLLVTDGNGDSDNGDGNNVPEPGTLALAGIGLMGLGVLHRRVRPQRVA